MQRFVTHLMIAAGFVAILSMPAAYAQRAYAQQDGTLQVNVPFNFTARGTECPAGRYFFKEAPEGVIDLTDSSRKIHVFMPIITSLARSGAKDDHLLAFDKVGGARILSEVWLPGTEGALVMATQGEHKHDIVRLNRNAPK